jgi:hypothetical protein
MLPITGALQPLPASMRAMPVHDILYRGARHGPAGKEGGTLPRSPRAYPHGIIPGFFAPVFS